MWTPSFVFGKSDFYAILLGMEIKDIEKLAKLARIELTEGEKETLLKEVDPILNYVAQLKEVVKLSSSSSNKVGDHRNILREDIVKNDSGSNTEALVAEFPEKEGNSLKVKKIL